jgi:hypothetical protein
MTGIMATRSHKKDFVMPAEICPAPIGALKAPFAGGYFCDSSWLKLVFRSGVGLAL